MSTNTEAIFIEALSLPERARASLVQKLLLSFEPESSALEIEAAWKQAALDRCQGFDAGHLEIVGAEYATGCQIDLSFNDGTHRVMDFEPFLRKATNPDITKYRQLRNFKKFHLHYGDLMWGDFEMIFPIEDLHQGKI